MVPHLVGIVLEPSAPSAAYKYSNGWRKWKTWAQSKLGVPVFPAVPLQVALYLTELVERAVLEGHSASVVESASYSIRWGHHLAGMDSPTIHPLMKGVVEGARRKLARPVQPKQSLKHDSIAWITLTLGPASASLADIGFLFILLVGYAGVFRISEVLSIRVRDVTISDDFMKVHLIKRKNDQYRDRHVSFNS